MQPHQQRVVDEQFELEDKLTKLDNFMRPTNQFFELCDKFEKYRLIRQYNAMWQYNEILKERIEAFNRETE